MDQYVWARVLRAVADPGSAPVGVPTLAAVVGPGLDVSPDSVGCSITVQHGRGFATPAATGPVAVELDAAQYRAGSGPCIAAARDGGARRGHGRPSYWVRCVRGGRAVPRGGVVAVVAGGHRAAPLLARVVATVLGPGQLAGTSQASTTASSGVDQRRVVVMAARDSIRADLGLTSGEAFEILARRSGEEQRPLVDVARDVLAEHRSGHDHGEESGR